MKTKEEREQLQYKFEFFVENYTRGIEEIKGKLKLDSAGTLNSFLSSKLKSSISQPYMESIERHYEIPLKIWDRHFLYDREKLHGEIEKYKNTLEEQKREKKIFKSLKEHQLIPKGLNNKEVLTGEYIDKVVKDYKEKLFENREDGINKLFSKNLRVWEKLKGDWYAYLYSSEVFNQDQYIHQVKTSFYGDYQVMDEFENQGKLFMGDNQSIIVKKTPNEKNFSLIVFNHTHVTYGTFRFTIFSIQNGTGSGGEEMVNWGFYTKDEVSLEEAEDILGTKEGVQIKLDLDFAKRVRQNITI